DNINMQFDNFRRNSPWSKEQLEKLSQKLDDLMRKGR
ncbi:MAG: NYN domain-containing protein, partial [Enterococcus hirae]|nr:NYN domain-containing protein [Enterococcus hirae]